VQRINVVPKMIHKELKKKLLGASGRTRLSGTPTMHMNIELYMLIPMPLESFRAGIEACRVSKA